MSVKKQGSTSAKNVGKTSPKKRGRKPKKQEGAVGLGDVTENAIKFATLGQGKKIAQAYEKMTGKSCGCEDRKEWLNAKGQEVLNFFFKGRYKCPNEQQKKSIAMIRPYVKESTGMIAVDTKLTTGQITKLYNAVMGKNMPVPTCKCQSTLNKIATWTAEMQGMVEMCEK